MSYNINFDLADSFKRVSNALDDVRVTILNKMYPHLYPQDREIFSELFDRLDTQVRFMMVCAEAHPKIQLEESDILNRIFKILGVVEIIRVTSESCEEHVPSVTKVLSEAVSVSLMGRYLVSRREELELLCRESTGRSLIDNGDPLEGAFQVESLIDSLKAVSKVYNSDIEGTKPPKSYEELLRRMRKNK